MDEPRIGYLLASDPTVVLLKTLRGESLPAPRLRFGNASLALFGRVDDWAQDGFLPAADIFLFGFEGATAHTDAGILVTARGQTVADTRDHAGTATRLPSPARHLAGTWLSLLLGNAGNHFHFLLLGLARLAVLTPALLQGVAGVLIPAGLDPSRRDIVERALTLVNGGTPLAGVRREVGADEAVRPDRLLLPWNAANAPALRFLRQLAPDVVRPWRRIYIDRRASPLRPLAGETEVITALRAHRVEPIRLETLPLEQQAALFSEAALVVGAHGAGLANLAFSGPGTRILEIMPDGVMNWCYRALAAHAALTYDCVLSRTTLQSGQDGFTAPHRIVLDHLLAAIA